MKQIRLILTSLILLFSITITARGNEKENPNQPAYYNLNPEGGVTGNIRSNNPPPEQVFSRQKQELLNRLNTARQNEDLQTAQYLQMQLNRLEGTIPVTMQNDPNLHTINSSRVPFQQAETDYNTSPVRSGTSTVSVATATTPAGAPNAGRLWCAYTGWSASNPDTLTLAYSDNGGVTWTIHNGFYFGYNMNFKNRELDIEVVYDGTTVWVFGVAGFYHIGDGRDYCYFFRFNTATNTLYSTNIQPPGFSTTTNRYYNPKITSDNSNYTSAAYVYIFCAFDSLAAGGTRFLRQKGMYINNPFAPVPSFNYHQPFGGGWFWFYQGQLPSIYQYVDIAYYNASGINRVFVSIQYSPNNSMGLYDVYTSWSNDYMATIAGNLSLSETNPSIDAKLAFNGGGSNQAGMVVYNRQFSGNDWDPRYRSTLNGGTTIGDWSAGFIDASVYRSRSTNLIGVRGQNNQFKIGYIQDSTAGNVPFAFYAGWNAGNINAPSRLAISPGNIDSSFCCSVPGYKIGGGDDCIGFYSMFYGMGVYASRACLTTTGITNNQVPVNFSLSQNYPNPFNPKTVISFQLAVNSLTKLVVYDMTGREAATLVNGYLDQGNYEAEWDGTNYSSGVYLYRLMVRQAGSSAEEFIETKKMLLVK